MPKADSLSTPACPSAKAAGEIMAALSRVEAAEAVRTPDLDLCGHLADRLDHLEAALSWVRPLSADGALAHLLLAHARADLLPQVKCEVRAEAVRRTMARHLYAVRHFLLARADLADPKGWQALINAYMPDADDRSLS